MSDSAKTSYNQSTASSQSLGSRYDYGYKDKSGQKNNKNTSAPNDAESKSSSNNQQSINDYQGTPSYYSDQAIPARKINWQDTAPKLEDGLVYASKEPELSIEDYRERAVTPKGYDKLEELKSQLSAIFDDLSTPIIEQVKQKEMLEKQIEELEKDIQLEAKDRASLFDRNPERYSKMAPEDWEACFDAYKNDLNYLDDAVAKEEMTKLDARKSIDMKYGDRTEDIKIIEADKELKKFVDLMSANDPDTNYSDYFAVYKKPDTKEVYIGKDDGGDSLKISRFDGDTIAIPIDANFKTITIVRTNIRNIVELPQYLETMWLDDMQIEYLPILPQGLKKVVVKTSKLSSQAKERLIKAMSDGCIVIGKDLNRPEVSRIYDTSTNL